MTRSRRQSTMRIAVPSRLVVQSPARLITWVSLGSFFTQLEFRNCQFVLNVHAMKIRSYSHSESVFPWHNNVYPMILCPKRSKDLHVSSTVDTLTLDINQPQKCETQNEHCKDRDRAL